VCLFVCFGFRVEYGKQAKEASQLKEEVESQVKELEAGLAEHTGE